MQSGHAGDTIDALSKLQHLQEQMVAPHPGLLRHLGCMAWRSGHVANARMYLERAFAADGLNLSGLDTYSHVLQILGAEQVFRLRCISS